MKIIGLMLARNEDWCIGMTARAAKWWVDELVILNHASTDETGDIIGEVCGEEPGRVHTIIEGDPVWREMKFRDRMLNVARSRGATHIATIDADEILTGNLLSSVRMIVHDIPPFHCYAPHWLQLRGSIDRYHLNGVWSRQKASMVFPDDKRYFWAAQGQEGYDFHHRAPMGLSCTQWQPGYRVSGGLMHLQMVSERRLKAKQALYKMTEVLRWPGKRTVAEINAMYDPTTYGDPDPKQTALGRTLAEWWKPYESLALQHLHVHREPWQEAEVRRLYELHGADKFKGLDLYGVEK